MSRSITVLCKSGLKANRERASQSLSVIGSNPWNMLSSPLRLVPSGGVTWMSDCHWHQVAMTKAKAEGSPQSSGGGSVARQSMRPCADIKPLIRPSTTGELKNSTPPPPILRGRPKFERESNFPVAERLNKGLTAARSPTCADRCVRHATTSTRLMISCGIFATFILCQDARPARQA
eukprot:3652331-Pyramimonas_sp.AAC.2